MGSDTLQDFVLWGIRPHWQIKTLQNQTKSFESLPFSLKGPFSKIVCMYTLHYPRLIVSMLKEPPILKMVFVLRGMIPVEPLSNSKISVNLKWISKIFWA